MDAQMRQSKLKLFQEHPRLCKPEKAHVGNVRRTLTLTLGRRAIGRTPSRWQRTTASWFPSWTWKLWSSCLSPTRTSCPFHFKTTKTTTGSERTMTNSEKQRRSQQHEGWRDEKSTQRQKTTRHMCNGMPGVSILRFEPAAHDNGILGLLPYAGATK